MAVVWLVGRRFGCWFCGPVWSLVLGMGNWVDVVGIGIVAGGIGV